MLATFHAPPACVCNDALAAGPRPLSSTVRMSPLEPIVKVVLPVVPDCIKPEELLKSSIPLTTTDPAPATVGCVAATSTVVPDPILSAPLIVVPPELRVLIPLPLVERF